MKGFFSFVLLLSLILLLIQSSFYLSPYSKNFPSEELILSERIYQMEMNLKENAFEGARQGAQEGILEYTAIASVSGFDVEEAKEYVKTSIQEKLSMLDSIKFEDFEFKLWCGNPSKQELRNLKQNMLSENKLLTCDLSGNCFDAGDSACKEYIDVNFLLEVQFGEIPTLNSITLGNEEGIFGASIYSEKFRISSVFTLPKKEVPIIA